MKQKLEPLFYKSERVDGYFFDPSTDIVYFLKSMNGRKVKFSTKTKKEFVARAKVVANQKLKELFGDKKIQIFPLIKDELPKWRAVKTAEGLDHGTLQKIKQAIPRIEGFWGSKFPKEIDADSFSEWLAWLSKEYPGQQKFNAIKYFKNFARYMNSKQHEGYALLPAVPRMSDPDHRQNMAARKKKTERILTKSEFRKILRAADPTEYLVAQIMCRMATRIEETLNMSFGEQILRNKNGSGWTYVWSIGQNKADLIGQHQFPDDLRIALDRRYQELRSTSSYRLFPQLFDPSKALRPQQIDWADWRKRAKLGWHWTSKTFRHTCLSQLFNNPRYSHAVICALYRVSLKVAIETYVKPTKASVQLLKNASDAWA